MNLSLKSLMKEVDLPDVQHDSTLNCYRMALRDLRANLVVTSPEFKRSVQSRLDRLIVTVSRKTTKEILESAAARLTDLLVEYRDNEEQNFEQEQLQLRKTIAALENLVKSIAKQDHECGANLTAVLSGLENTLFEGDLLSIHRSLQEQIRRLRACVVTIADESQQRATGFGEHIESLRNTTEQRVNPVADRVEQDQFGAGSVLAEYVESRPLFSVVFVRIDDFAEISKHWSLSCRKALIAAIEHRLKVAAGTVDKIHQWREGEFAIIVSSTLARASERAETFRRIVTNSWPIELPFGQAKIDVRCSVGTAEYVSGESLASLVERTQEALDADAKSRGKLS